MPMILDQDALDEIRGKAPDLVKPLLEALDQQKKVIETLLSQQESQREEISKLNLMLLEMMGVLRAKDMGGNEAFQKQISDAISHLSQISASTMVAISKVSSDIVENGLGKEGLEELAELMVFKNKRSTWEFDITRGPDGRMKSIKAKETKV